MAYELFRLTPEQKKSLLELKSTVDLLGIEIERAKKVGFDVTGLEDEFKKAKTLYENVLKEYS